MNVINILCIMLEAVMMVYTTESLLGKKTKKSIYVLEIFLICIAGIIFKRELFPGYLISIYFILLLFCGSKGSILKQAAAVAGIEVIIICTKLLSVSAKWLVMSNYSNQGLIDSYITGYLGTLMTVWMLVNIVLYIRRKQMDTIGRGLINILLLVMILICISIMKICESTADIVLISDYLEIIFLISLLGIGISCVGIAYSQINNRFILSNRMLKDALISKQGEMINIEEDYQNARKIRHDINRDLNIFIRLLDDKNYEELKNEIKNQIKNTVGRSYIHIKNNNKISAVINEKLSICETEHIELSVSDTTEISSEKEMDIAIAMSNLLDNAIEAQNNQKDYKIQLSLYEKNGMYNLLIKNPIYTSVQQENGRFITHKQDAEEHGVGMEIVKDIVEKYDGLLDFEESDNSFLVHMVIPV